MITKLLIIVFRPPCHTLQSRARAHAHIGLSVNIDSRGGLLLVSLTAQLDGLLHALGGYSFLSGEIIAVPFPNTP